MLEPIYKHITPYMEMVFLHYQTFFKDRDLTVMFDNS